MGDYGERIRITSKQRVVGSNPTWDTMKLKPTLLAKKEYARLAA
jgi:hypothetical protein